MIDVKNLVCRMWTSIVFIIFFALLGYFGNELWSKIFFLLYIILLLTIGLQECISISLKLGYNLSLLISELSGCVLLSHFFLQSIFYPDDPLPMWLVLFVVFAIIYFGMLFYDNTCKDILVKQSLTFMFVLYLGIGLGFQINLFFFNGIAYNNLGWKLIFSLYFIICLGDSMAYFVGSYFGRHRFSKVISPMKTIEGVCSGFFGNLIALLIIKLIIFTHLLLSDIVKLTLLLGIFGQLGDLIESAWKRNAGIKDSSIDCFVHIPGHGGLLDRLDSLIFTAPVLYLYVSYFMKLS